MTERMRADEVLLAEVGWLTIQWARLEGYVDLISAYLLKKFNQNVEKVPPSFSGRVSFIRKSLRGHAFLGVYMEATFLLDAAMSASRKRNDLVHGIVTGWNEDASGRQTLLRQGKVGYIAVQDLPLEKQQVEELTRRVRLISASLFNLLEKIKAIVGFLNYEADFWEIATLEVPND